MQLASGGSSPCFVVVMPSKTADKKWISKWQKINLRLFSIFKTLISPKSGKEKKMEVRKPDIWKFPDNRNRTRCPVELYHTEPNCVHKQFDENCIYFRVLKWWEMKTLLNLYALSFYTTNKSDTPSEFWNT